MAWMGHVIAYSGYQKQRNILFLHLALQFAQDGWNQKTIRASASDTGAPQCRLTDWSASSHSFCKQTGFASDLLLARLASLMEANRFDSAVSPFIVGGSNNSRPVLLWGRGYFYCGW
jgi:hypothetical protein